MPPSLSIKHFYENESDPEADGRELQPAITLPPLGEEHRPALDRLIEWGKERKELSELLTYCEAGNEDSDEAMQALAQRFPVKNRTRRVHVPPELVDQYGGGNTRNLRFGVQDVNTDEQLEKLKEQVEEMKKYFPHIGLFLTMDPKTGRRTALVMGIEVHLYNSLVKAQEKKKQLNGAVRAACKDLNVPEEWVDRKIEQKIATSRPREQGPVLPPKKKGREK